MDNMRTIGLPSDIIAKCQIDIGILLHGICKARGMTQGGATSLGLGKAKSVEFRTLAWKNPCSWPIKLHCNLGNSSEAFQNTKTHLNLVKLTEWSNFYPGNQLETHGFWTPIDFCRVADAPTKAAATGVGAAGAATAAGGAGAPSYR